MTLIDGGNAFSFGPDAPTPAPTPGPLFAPYAATYSTTEPYITAAEFLAAPTGVNVSSIVPGGSAAVNRDALEQTIRRASSWADTICHQVLAATELIQSGTYRVQPGGVMIPVDASPVVQINSISAGRDQASRVALSSLSGVGIDRQVITVPRELLGGTSGRVSMAVSYVAGFANTTLTGAAFAGDSVIVVSSVAGVAPGMALMIHDPGVSEAVRVHSTDGLTVHLLEPLQAAHGVGVGTSALPPAIKQAVILLTSSLIKTRGAQAIVMGSARGSAQSSNIDPAASGGRSEQILAEKLLAEFVRVA